jgi:Flp pilus assembly protein TadG
MKLRGTTMARGLLRSRQGSVHTASFRQRIVELLRSDCSGSALVELAFALPVYLIVLTGMVSIVMSLFAYQQLAFATFSASEAIGARRGLNADPCALAGTQLGSSLPDWSQNNLTITVWITQKVAGVETKEQYGPFVGVANSTCTGDVSTPGNGSYAYNLAEDEPVTVRASYTYNWLPIYGNPLTSGPLVAAESSIIR